jgi:hypothetical protein
VISSDDRTATEWLTTIAREHPAHFLASLWEALVKANDDDYSIIRPALMELKRKYANLHGRATVC